jgi:hypothetical protein
LSSVATALVKSELITGAVDDDDDYKEKKVQYETIKPKSINISALRRVANGLPPETRKGDVWVEYSKFGVPGMVMAAKADMFKNMTKEDIEKTPYIFDLFNSFKGTAKTAINNSFLQGTSVLLNAITGGEKETNRWSINTLGALSSSVYPNTLAVISKSSDKYIRDVRPVDGDFSKELVNSFKNKMFMGKDLPYKTTLWGEPVTGLPEGRDDRFTYYLLDVTKAQKVNTDDFGYKIYELWKDLKKTDEKKAVMVLPQPPINKITIGNDKITLTEPEYNEYQSYVGKERKALTKAYVEGSEFDNDSMDDKIRNLKSIYRQGKELGYYNFINNNARMKSIIANYGDYDYTPDVED